MQDEVASASPIARAASASPCSKSGASCLSPRVAETPSLAVPLVSEALSSQFCVHLRAPAAAQSGLEELFWQFLGEDELPQLRMAIDAKNEAVHVEVWNMISWRPLIDYTFARSYA